MDWRASYTCPRRSANGAGTSMSEAHLFAIGVLLAWLAGIRVYLTVFGVGLAGALGWLDLPQALQVTTVAVGARRFRRAGGRRILRRQDPRRGFGLGPAADAGARAGRRVPRRRDAVARRRARRRHARHRRRRRADQPRAEGRLARADEHLAGAGQQLDRVGDRGRRGGRRRWRWRSRIRGSRWAWWSRSACCSRCWCGGSGAGCSGAHPSRRPVDGQVPAGPLAGANCAVRCTLSGASAIIIAISE